MQSRRRVDIADSAIARLIDHLSPSESVRQLLRFSVIIHGRSYERASSLCHVCVRQIFKYPETQDKFHIQDRRDAGGRRRRSFQTQITRGHSKRHHTADGKKNIRTSRVSLSKFNKRKKYRSQETFNGIFSLRVNNPRRKFFRIKFYSDFPKLVLAGKSTQVSVRNVIF